MPLPGYTASGSVFLPTPVSASGGGGVAEYDATKVVETHGAIAELTDVALAAVFTNADDAQPGDLINVGADLYRMQVGATDARQAASWARDTTPPTPVDTTYLSTSTSTNPLTHAAIAQKFGALVTVSEAAPNVSESEWEIWVQRSANGSTTQIFQRVAPGAFVEAALPAYVNAQDEAVRQQVVQWIGEADGVLRDNLVLTSADPPDLSNGNWIIWVQRPADNSFIEAFLKVSTDNYMSIGRIS